MNRSPSPPPDSRRLLAGFHSRGGLPHLKREGGIYFVTFRLAGTLPQTVLVRFKAERAAVLERSLAAKRPLAWHEREELFRWYADRVDKYLDAGSGDCWLRRPEIARLVAEAIRFHRDVRFELQAWCVMPNHVHVVLRPLADWTLSRILKGWKGFTGRRANQILNRTGKAFWQTESFDHLVRDENDLHRCRLYTVQNPVNAGLCARPEDWEWSSAYQAPK